MSKQKKGDEFQEFIGEVHRIFPGGGLIVPHGKKRADVRIGGLFDSDRGECKNLKKIAVINWRQEAKVKYKAEVYLFLNQSTKGKNYNNSEVLIPLSLWLELLRVYHKHHKIKLLPPKNHKDLRPEAYKS